MSMPIGYEEHVLWENPLLDTQANAESVVSFLEAVRSTGPESRVYQASTSEMFWRAPEAPQNERTPLSPAEPV